MARIPAGCIRKEAASSPLNARDMDLPSPQPGQNSTPALLNKQNVGSSDPGTIVAARISATVNAIHSKWKKKLLFTAAVFNFINDLELK